MRDEGRHDPIDALIETTARAMTEGTPPGSLRAVVRGRIEEITPGRERRGVGRLAWSAGAAAAVALLIVGVGRDEAPTTVRPAPSPVVAVVPPAETRPRATSAVAAQPPERMGSGPARPALPTSAGGTGDVAADAEPIVIELVEVEPLRPELLEMELMEVPMPLRAESVQIDPISIE